MYNKKCISDRSKSDRRKYIPDRRKCIPDRRKCLPDRRKTVRCACISMSISKGQIKKINRTILENGKIERELKKKFSG